MAFGSGGGKVTGSGDDILAEWNFEGGVDPWSAFGSLMGPYEEMLNIGIENMRAQQPRDAQAFDLWKRGKASDLEGDKFGRDMARKSYHDDRSAMFAANKRRQQAEAAGRSHATPEGRIEQSRQYMEGLTNSPWDFQFARPSAARNLIAAGNIAGSPFPENPWITMYDTAAKANPGAAFQALQGNQDRRGG